MSRPFRTRRYTAGTSAVRRADGPQRNTSVRPSLPPQVPLCDARDQGTCFRDSVASALCPVPWDTHTDLDRTSTSRAAVWSHRFHPHTRRTRAQLCRPGKPRAASAVGEPGVPRGRRAAAWGRAGRPLPSWVQHRTCLLHGRFREERGSVPSADQGGKTGSEGHARKHADTEGTLDCWSTATATARGRPRAPRDRCPVRGRSVSSGRTRTLERAARVCCRQRRAAAVAASWASEVPPFKDAA